MAQRRGKSRRAQEVPRFSRAARNQKAARRGPAWAQPAAGSRPWWMPRRDAPVQPVPVIQVSGRKAQAMAMAAQAYAQMAAAGLQAGQAAQPGAALPQPARLIPLRPPRQAWRFRKHLQPFAWLVLLLAAGASLHAVPHGRVLWGVLASAAVPGLMLLAAGQRHRDGKHIFRLWTRRFVYAQAVVTGFWMLLLAAYGVRPCGPWVVVSALPFLGLWVRRYRWRPRAEKAPAAPDSDVATFTALADAQKWSAVLGERQDLPGGGRRYLVQCDGIKTVMPKILAVPDNVAGAWHRPATEVYAERDEAGVPSRGSLTILTGQSLRGGRAWDGQGMDLVTGLARSGRFADGRDSHDKWYQSRFGCYHDLDSGTTGSGKSERLNIKVFTALATGWFVPVILDPQEGQSLPFWQDKCIYARGAAEVERRIRGLHAGFLDRSSYLSTYRWNDDGVDMPGMPFFDYEMLGGRLKIVLVILDEAHLVLKDGNKWQRQVTANVVEMARLIRKAGGRMVLATQLPGLVDLGGSQALRDMLRGGNVWSGRTANSVGQGMLGLAKDPSGIPRYFADGTATAGLGYTDGPDRRPDAPMRCDYVSKEHYRNPPPVPRLDDRFMEVMDRAMRESVSPTSAAAPVAAAPAKGGLRLLGGTRDKPAEPSAEAPEDAPEGRRCIDAVLQVLQAAGGPADRGQVAAAVAAVSAEWGRPKCWSLRQIGNTLRELTEAGQAVQADGKGSAYRIAPEN
jgi:hypothetical protein